MGSQQVFARTLVGSTEGFWFIYEARRVPQNRFLDTNCLASKLKLSSRGRRAFDSLVYTEFRKLRLSGLFWRVFRAQRFYHFAQPMSFPIGEKMGLNDLTLEKLVSEINGYKGKMRSIHEDYGRASSDLQDRINVLGYNLNEHLRETKDQMANTPQRLLNLETKYVTGEVTDTDYRRQREEFKELLERNLRSIEEIKTMIGVLQEIEVRPLVASEFKQPTPAATAKATGEEWGRGVLSQDKPFAIPQPTSQTVTPPQTGLRVTSEQLGPEKSVPAERSVPASSPSPPQPQSNGNSWTNPAPQSNAATITAWGPVFAPPLSVQPGPSVPLSTEYAAESSFHDTGEVSVEDSVVTIPTVDILGEPGNDDTLMVKVVDDVPALGASTAIETSALQTPSITGTDTAPATPSAPDLAQVSLTPPTQFYQVVCPKCGADVPKPAKVWELKGGKSKKNVLIGLFQCQDCRVKFREALTREII